jgi:putative ABC transport system permease protein
VLAGVEAVPGVESAGATLNRFVPGFFMLTRVHIEDAPTPDGQPRVVHFRRAAPGTFRTMRTPILRGRDFSDQDRLDQPPVAIVSRQFAELYWPGRDPIGRRLQRGASPRWLTVVGVAGDVSDVALSQAPAPTVYVPFSQNNVAVTPVSLVVRTRADPLALGAAIRAAVLAVDPEQPIDSLNTLERFLADSLGPQRFRTTLLLMLGAIGVALAALGVYGVTSRFVSERTPELGVRLALGASPASLAGLVVLTCLRAVLGGLAIGAVLAAAAAAAIFRLLPEVEQATLWVTAPAFLVLAAVAIVAAGIPARRATALAPIVALRAD